MSPIYLIIARVKVLVCNVNSQLKLSDDEGESMTEHIVGTHMDDLTQIYNGKVVIKGSADVGIIYTSQEYPITDSQVHVNGVPMDFLNLGQKYWMKKINQVF